MNILVGLIYSLRPWQWIKNFFILLPLVFGEKIFSFPANFRTGIAFLLFCLVSGSMYLINDIVDAERDRVHPKKKNRPIASGKVGKKQAIVAAVVLLGVSLTGAFCLNMVFGLICITYIVFNILYSKVLKHAVIIDVFCISFFFILRIMAGSVVADVTLSHWMIAMTALLALFLGFNKRRQELHLLEEGAIAHRQVLDKYNVYFIDQMLSVTTSSIVVAYMLYTVDARTVQEFGTTNLLYTVPFVYYGIFRYLYLIHEREEDGDPTNILLSDRKMLVNLIIWVLVCCVIIYGSR